MRRYLEVLEQVSNSNLIYKFFRRLLTLFRRGKSLSKKFIRSLTRLQSKAFSTSESENYPARHRDLSDSMVRLKKFVAISKCAKKNKTREQRRKALFIGVKNFENASKRNTAQAESFTARVVQLSREFVARDSKDYFCKFRETQCLQKTRENSYLYQFLANKGLAKLLIWKTKQKSQKTQII